jgi:hypothetical protein
MSGTKTFMLYAVLVMVVICFNTPVVSGEHPWDQTIPGSGGGGSGSTWSNDTTLAGNPGDYAWNSGSGKSSLSGLAKYERFIFSVGFAFWYRDLPESMLQTVGVVRDVRIIMTEK